jgi:hypothetical protein
VTNLNSRSVSSAGRFPIQKPRSVGQLGRLLHMTSHQSAKAAIVVAHEIRNAAPISLIQSQKDTTQFPVGPLPHPNLREILAMRQCRSYPVVSRRKIWIFSDEV